MAEPGWGDRIKEWFVDSVWAGALVATGPLKPALEWMLDLVGVRAGTPTTGVKELFYDFLLGSPNLPPEMRSLLERARSMDNVSGNIVMMLAIFGSVMSLGGPALQPYTTLMQYFGNRVTKPGRLNPTEAWQAVFRNGLTESAAQETIKDLGFGDEAVEAYRKLARNIPSISDLAQMHFRGLLDLSEVQSKLKDMGYDTDDANRLINIFPLIPPVSDLIRFQVREVFTPSIAEKFGQYQDFPEGILEQTRKQGLPDEAVRWYWAAHWELPSVGQGYEMLHRIDRSTGKSIIDISELETLLRAADVMPFWRDKLIAISFNPYTRVDTRRMAALGILDREEVTRTFQDLGYDREHAENLAKFTFAEKHAANKDLAKADIVDGYARGVFNRDEASTILSELGYDAAEVNFFLDRQDYLLEKKNLEDELDVIKLSFINGLIEDSEMEGRLGRLNVAETRKQRLLLEWRLAKSRKLQTPSVSQLQSFLRQDVIDEQRFRLEMDKRGYNAEYTDMFLREIKPELSPAQVMSQFKQRIITEAEFVTRMTELGYNADDIQSFVEQLTPEPTVGQLQTFLRKASITEADFRRELQLRGYSPQWIDAFVKSTVPAPKKGK